MYEPDYKTDIDAELYVRIQEYDTRIDQMEVTIEGPTGVSPMTLPLSINEFGMYGDLQSVGTLPDGNVLASYTEGEVVWNPNRDEVYTVNDERQPPKENFWTKSDGFVEENESDNNDSCAICEVTDELSKLEDDV